MYNLEQHFALFISAALLLHCAYCCLQIAPIVDAGSSQSRADVLGILLSAVLLLTGLQWLALKPKVVDAVSSSGRQRLVCWKLAALDILELYQRQENLK